MFLSSLHIESLRNIVEVDIGDFARINLLFGENGAGKSSVLEALYILSIARSFRSARLSNVIQTEKPHLLVSGTGVDGTRLGVLRGRDDKYLIKCNGEMLRSISELANIFPVQVFNEASFDLLVGGPKPRRELIDWGVFHVEHSFIVAWKALQRVLKQRNAILRSQHVASLKQWDQQFVQLAERVHACREHWFETYRGIFLSVLDDLAPNIATDMAIKYYPGWDVTQSLQESLDSHRDSDLHRGYTQSGPHRCDIRIRYMGKPAQEVLSRGQQKVVVSALKIAQGEVLKSSGKASVYLVDDLLAELDGVYAQRFADRLYGSCKQLFVTGIESVRLQGIFDDYLNECAMFHVEHGRVTRV